MLTWKIGILSLACLTLSFGGCDKDLKVGTFVSNSEAVCAHYEACDATYDEQSCLDDGAAEANRLKKMDGADCQGYVDLLADYYGCLANTLTCDATSSGDCTAESVTLGEFQAEPGFDCAGSFQ